MAGDSIQLYVAVKTEVSVRVLLKKKEHKYFSRLSC